MLLSAIESYDLDSGLHSAISRVVLILPISITALVKFSSQFDRGKQWELLRSLSEALKTEIYYYRTCVGDYKENRDAVMAERMQILTLEKDSPVHQSALSPYEEEISRHNQIKDDKCSDLTDPNDYLRYRLENQYSWYRLKAKRLAKRHQTFQIGVYLFGGLGTLFASFEHSLSWVAVTTSAAGAFTYYLDLRRVEDSLVSYNQAAESLYTIRAWWYSLSETERSKPDNFKRLVDRCEGAIRDERTNWFKDMEDRFKHLENVSKDKANGEAENSEKDELSEDSDVGY